MNILQKDLSIIRTYSAEQNGMFAYNLMLNGDPVHIQNSGNTYDFAVVNINPDDYSVHMEMYRNQDSVPDTDMNDVNTFLIPVILL